MNKNRISAKTLWMGFFVFIFALAQLISAAPAMAKNTPIAPAPQKAYDTSTLKFDLSNATFTDPVGSRARITMYVRNRTGGKLYMSLSGAATYNFTFGKGLHTIRVRRGTYNYYVTARCGTAAGTVKLAAGKVWTWTCN